MSLDDTRRRIDSLDEQIVRLLDERALCGREVARHKNSLGLPLRNPAREDEVVARLLSLSDGSMPPRSLENIYRAIMSETLALQGTGACAGPVPSPGKQDLIAEIRENREIAPGFHMMRLAAPGLANLFQPGQFFQFRADPGGCGLFLRRPFAPSECDPDGEGMAFHYAVVGTGTRRMTAMRPGETAHVLAPLGNAFPLAEPGARALVIGGGCGAPSLAPLVRTLHERGVPTSVLLGARTGEAILHRQAFAAYAETVIVATEDGSMGQCGNVVDAYHGTAEGLGRFDIVYSCGPHAMLRAVAKMAGDLGVPCQVSLEERMACGFGACMGCVVPVLDGGGAGGTAYRRVCHEGPVFDAATLAWEAMG